MNDTRMQERHYVISELPEDRDYSEDHPSFSVCSPENRLKGWCPVCQAVTTDDLSKLARRWDVEHHCWAMFAIVDTEAEAKGVVGEDRLNDGCGYDYHVRPLWMVKAEIEQCPEWEV